jgi:uncharacterized protein
MFGANQAECCDGETIDQCPVPTSDVAAVSPVVLVTPADSLAALRAAIAETPPLPALLAIARARLDDDPGHDIEHALRVVLWTVRIGGDEVELRHAVAAGLFHDLVNVPKSSPERHLASSKSAEAADGILAENGYGDAERALIRDAIRDHSYSRGARPSSALGRALQDADRLEALGVLGVFRTISTGARLGGRYFHADDPWATARPLDDRAFSVDHFFTKLLRLPATMCTVAGRHEAERRADRMRLMLQGLGEELGRPYVPHPSAD